MDIDELVEYLREENALDICVISVPSSLDYVDYFVVCSGYGARHLRKMADGLVAEVCDCCWFCFKVVLSPPMLFIYMCT